MSHSGEKDPLVPLQSQDALKAAGEAAERTSIQPQQVFQTGPPAAFFQEGKEGIKGGGAGGKVLKLPGILSCLAVIHPGL